MQTENGVVMIVDDVPENLALLCDALDEAGYIVSVATDGRSALQRLQHVAPDAILLDAMMPGWDGFETCERLKADSRWSDIPVLFMTGLTETEHVVRGFASGGIDYVTKPINPEEVIARVAAHVSTARRLEEARASKQRIEPIIHPTRAENLTQREAEVLNWLAKGKTNRDIAEILGMSPRTVNKHLEHIYVKLGVETRTAAASIARERLVPTPA
ncbi:MAG TPA: response regulator [Burkholderiales bacterium]|nr:response regulator [Burkholderiales bacterium]